MCVDYVYVKAIGQGSALRTSQSPGEDQKHVREDRVAEEEEKEKVKEKEVNLEVAVDPFHVRTAEIEDPRTVDEVPCLPSPVEVEAEEGRVPGMDR